MPVLNYEDKIGVLPSSQEDCPSWGVCCVVHGRSDTPETSVRCITCSSYACPHVKTLKMALTTGTNDDDALALFSQALCHPISMKMRYEKVSSTNTSIPVFPGSKFYQFSNLGIYFFYFDLLYFISHSHINVHH